MHSYIITKNSVTVMVNGKACTISSTDTTYQEAIDAITNKDWNKLASMVNKSVAIEQFGSGKLVVKDGYVYYNGEVLHSYVVERVLDFIKSGIDSAPLLKFIERLMSNPSKRCVDQLYTFLEHKNMPIDEDGCFYAYKAVRSDWLDKHTGTIRNEIGDIITMPRNQVDDDPTHACSHGLHVGSLQYVQGFASLSDKIVIVKVAPEDVVSVPDNETTKMRCCKYQVVGIYEGPLPENTYKANPVYIDYEYEDEYEDEGLDGLGDDEEDFDDCYTLEDDPPEYINDEPQDTRFNHLKLKRDALGRFIKQ